MKKIFLLILTLFLIVLPGFAEKNYTLKAGVLIENIPDELYGSWRISSNIISTNNPDIFKKSTIDLWNLSRVGDVITLENPFSGAHASITIKEVKGNFIKFEKVGDYDNKKLVDIVQLTLNKETFKGMNELKLNTVSEIDGHIIKTEWASYRLTGEKISGTNIK